MKVPYKLTRICKTENGAIRYEPIEIEANILKDPRYKDQWILLYEYRGDMTRTFTLQPDKEHAISHLESILERLVHEEHVNTLNTREAPLGNFKTSLEND